MNATIWAPVIGGAFGLGGVGLGAWVSLVGQRKSDKQILAARKAALRDDRRDAIYAFLEAAQVVDKIAERRYVNSHRDDAAATEAMHQLWYRQKCIDLIGGRPLHDACLDYTWRMHQAVWESIPEGMSVWDYMKEKRDPFLGRAKAELYAPEIYD